MNLSDLKKRINSLVSFVGFDYKDISCGIDPISENHFEMWYGDNFVIAKNIEEVFDIKIFDGKSLTEIFNNILNIDV